MSDYVNYMDIKKFKCASPFHAYVSCYGTMNFHNFIKHSIAPHKESGLAKKKDFNGTEIAELQGG